MFGDSMFESFLGTTVGYEVKRAEGVPAVWESYRKDSNKKVMAVSGALHTPEKITKRLSC